MSNSGDLFDSGTTLSFKIQSRVEILKQKKGVRGDNFS